MPLCRRNSSDHMADAAWANMKFCRKQRHIVQIARIIVPENVLEQNERDRLGFTLT